MLILDVRNPEERELCIIRGSLFIPLQELENRMDELNQFKEKEIVCYCHSGIRSAMAVSLLQTKGFNAKNLKGGIDRWADEIETGMVRY